MTFHNWKITVEWEVGEGEQKENMSDSREVSGVDSDTATIAASNFVDDLGVDPIRSTIERV